MCKNHCQEYLHNVYKLPSVEPTIRYHHGAAGFPTKTSWLKAIRKENYLSWPLINVKNVTKYFPVSEETQKGHMQGQRQGVRSRKVADPTEDVPTNIPHQKKTTFSSRNTRSNPSCMQIKPDFSPQYRALATSVSIRRYKVLKTSLLLLSSHAFHDGDRSPTGFEPQTKFSSPMARKLRVNFICSFNPTVWPPARILFAPASQRHLPPHRK